MFDQGKEEFAKESWCVETSLSMLSDGRLTSDISPINYIRCREHYQQEIDG